jgi:hypothetical protein
VELIPASEYAGVGTASSPSEWAFREDHASYNTSREGAVTRHTLSVEIVATPDSRAAVDTLCAVATAQGVVARVKMASGQVSIVGWSSRFETTYPLRLSRVDYSSGLSPADLPSIAITLECTH